MAKTGLWLRGARGKLAGTVLMKGENGTIARELVKPANKQTDAQMLQRIAFATVSKAATHLLPVIGMSFEGKTTEKENRREFIRRNVNLLKNDIKAQLAGEQTDNALSAKVVNKGDFRLIPNNYMLSSGSLTIPWWQTCKLNNNLIDFAQESVTFAHDESWTVRKFLEEVMQVSPGSQLTFCAFYPPVNEAYQGSIEEIRLVSSRIVFKNYSEAKVEYDEDTGLDDNSTTFEYVWELMSKVIDKDKSDLNAWARLLDMFEINYNEDDDTFKLNATLDNIYNPIWDHIKTKGNFILAYGCIHTKFNSGKWQYSNTQLVTLHDSDTFSIPNRYALALPTYLKSQSATASEFYTQQGGTQNSIG